MKLLLSHMRAGSHLAAAIMQLHPFVAHNEQTGEMMPVEKLINVLSMDNDIWTYYPYHHRLEYWIKHKPDLKPYLLLRDPRDIIVSTAHFCEKYPQTFLNYNVNGVRFSDMPVSRRIDYLIDDILHESLYDYERWRMTGLFELIRFRDLLKHPVAKIYHNWKRRGVVGAYKDEMTTEQIARCDDRYGELIEVWG